MSVGSSVKHTVSMMSVEENGGDLGGDQADRANLTVGISPVEAGPHQIMGGGYKYGHYTPGWPDQKRDPGHRIFVNRSLYLEKIKFYGFDMDYTLAEYKSPEYEKLGFELTKNRLITIGYPAEISSLEYDYSYPVRGLWFDYQLGNLLKVDGFGNILFCQHGFKFYNAREIMEKYPNKFIKLDDSRVYVLNTLFNLPETYLLAELIDFFGKHKDYTETKDGFTCGDLQMTYKSIFQDVRSSVDYVHMKGELKTATCKDLAKYVHKDKRLPQVLANLKASGAKTFLLTNSEWWYTNKVMDFILDFPDAPYAGKSWQAYFDFTFVDAQKPRFFGEGTVLRQVDKTTGRFKLGHHISGVSEGDVYSGGNSEALSKMIKAKGRDVLYVGDHIFGDVLKSKKLRGWRTFLIVPELNDELRVWTNEHKLFEKLQNFDKELSESWRNMVSSDRNRPDITTLKATIKEVSHTMEMKYGKSGSLFRSGSRQTFFASQVVRYADIYAGSVLNMFYYPPSYMFRAPPMLLPHESTVGHEQAVSVDSGRMSSLSGTPGPLENSEDQGNTHDHGHDMDDDDIIDIDDNDETTSEKSN